MTVVPMKVAVSLPSPDHSRRRRFPADFLWGADRNGLGSPPDTSSCLVSPFPVGRRFLSRLPNRSGTPRLSFSCLLFHPGLYLFFELQTTWDLMIPHQDLMIPHQDLPLLIGISLFSLGLAGVRLGHRMTRDARRLGGRVSASDNERNPVTSLTGSGPTSKG